MKTVEPTSNGRAEPTGERAEGRENPGFLFATGIENSDPTIKSGRVRVDELEKCGHYRYWETDFALVRDMGIRFLRYGIPLHRSWLGSKRYDWEFADSAFARLKGLEIVPIVDLCHFGVPDWIGNFQNPDFPECFARYAAAFAQRYPWLQLYTPVNEIYICARFSALYGWWNEQLQSDAAFVTALKHLVQANILAMRAILEYRPDAIFIQMTSNRKCAVWSGATPGRLELAATTKGNSSCLPQLLGSLGGRPFFVPGSYARLSLRLGSLRL